MKTYRGDRTIDGLDVTVDGHPLARATEVKAFSENGFEWGYDGEEPAQLALAILADHLEDKARAIALTDGFMHGIVANFGNEWELTSADVDEAVAALGG